MIGTIVIVRTYSAGVHMGELAERNGKEVLLKNAKRIWYWEGAATLSQLAVDGPGKPEKTKIPVAVPEIFLTEAIEIIPVSKKALDAFERVPVWSV